MLLALATAYFLVIFGYPRLTSGTQDGIVFGIILLFVLMPLIVLGLGTFGYFSLTGEYSSEEEK